MIRKILFRGKRKDTGEWVFGDLMDLIGKPFIYLNTIPFPKDRHIEVVPETVGQFIGLKDKNGNMIFEGDILSDDIHVIYMEEKASFITTYEGDAQNGSTLNSRRTSIIEVIGNIHDKNK